MVNPYTAGKRVPDATKDLEGFVLHTIGLRTEEDILNQAMMNRDTISALLSNPGAFERIRAKLTGLNRQFFELMLLNVQERVKWLNTALCQLKHVHMGLLDVVLSIEDIAPILYLKAKPEAMGGCGDKVAQEMFQQLMFGDKEATMPPEARDPSPRILGLWGVWDKYTNDIAGQIIMALGDNVFVDPPRPFLTKEQFEARVLEYRKKKLVESPIMAACPICRKFAPEFMRTLEGGQIPTGEFVRVMVKETSREAKYCVDCALAYEKEGKITILEPVKRLEPAAVPAPVPTPIPPPMPAAMKPSASFITDKKTGVAPLPVRFTDTSSGQPTFWEWDFGDGTPKNNEKNPAHLYLKPGTYSITLLVSNNMGAGFVMSPNLITVSEPAPVKEGEKPKVEAPTRVVLPKETPLTQPPAPKLAPAPAAPIKMLPEKATVAGWPQYGTVEVVGYTGEYNYVKVKTEDGTEVIVPDAILSPVPYTPKEEVLPEVKASLEALKKMGEEYRKEMEKAGEIEGIKFVKQKPKVQLTLEQKRRLLERSIKELKLERPRLIRLIQDQDIPPVIYRQFGIELEVSPGAPESPHSPAEAGENMTEIPLHAMDADELKDYINDAELDEKTELLDAVKTHPNLSRSDKEYLTSLINDLLQ